jgi:hypothetical protein
MNQQKKMQLSKLYLIKNFSKINACYPDVHSSIA